jgi:hypothetical protein
MVHSEDFSFFKTRFFAPEKSSNFTVASKSAFRKKASNKMAEQANNAYPVARYSNGTI